MKANDAIKTLEQFERLDDYQVAEIVKLINNQQRTINHQSLRLADSEEKLQTQALVLAARDRIICEQQDQFREATEMIERLKCCGNCVYLSPIHRIANCGRTGIDVCARDKCDKWEAQHD